ncbi:uncharacterized protein [Amphiura filiformis]
MVTDEKYEALLYIASCTGSINWNHLSVQSYCAQQYQDAEYFFKAKPANINYHARCRFQKRAKEYKVTEGALYKFGRRVLRLAEYQVILEKYHNENSHCGISELEDMLVLDFAEIDTGLVENYVSNCTYCTTSKGSADLQKKPKKRKIEDGQNKSEGPMEKCEASKVFQFSASPSLEKIRQLQKKFIEERDWDQFHAPRNVLLAMVGEVGEVAELFQWRGETKIGLPDWSEEDKKHLGQELSDVLLYLVDLAERCYIDLPKEAISKMSHNAVKYPVNKVKGSSKKYTEYE